MAVTTENRSLLKEKFQYGLKKAKQNADCYLYVAPFLIIFLVFTVAPIILAVGYSFTYYNIFEPAKFVGLKNYINMFVNDELFLQSFKNSLIIAVITGPAGYLMSLMFAWFINELPAKLRTVMVVIFYAPSISGSVNLMWSLIFSGDSYGYVNAALMNLGIVQEPIQFLTDTKYMMMVLIIVMLWGSLGTGFLSFVAGFKTVDRSMYEAGYVDGIRNRWQELWFITLPSMRPQMVFGAIMSLTSAFSVGDITVQFFGNPSTDYAVHTLVNHATDYGTVRFDMGYACAITTVLFLLMIISRKLIEKALAGIGN